jgi:hypothetical protein
MQRSFAALCGTFFTAALCAQSPGNLPAGAIGDPAGLRTPTALQPDGDGLLALGWDYRARITAQGLHYTPALGTAAATTQHLALSFVDVRRGETTAFEPAERPAAAIAGERRAVIAHGNVTERFDVTPAGIELSLAFAQPLPGRGDLVARYRLDTTLAAQPQRDDGLWFLLAGVGGVSIGGVTGVDAAGERVRGSLQIVGDCVELRLPGAFVDSALFPLVLDPLVGTQFLASVTPGSYSQPDAAYDVTVDCYLVVYRKALSNVAMEIRGNFVSSAGTPFGSLLAIASAPWLASPKVADLNLRDTFVVGYLQASSLFAFSELRARTVAAGVNQLSGVLVVDSPVTVVDVAGDNTTSGDAALFVYAKDAGGGNSTVELARATVGGLAATPVFTGRNNVQVPNTPVTDVAISKSNPSTDPYELAWVAGTNLFTRTALRDGSVPGTSFGVDSNVMGFEPGTVDVDGNGSDFQVAYQYDAAATGDSEIWLASLGTDLQGAQNFYGYTAVDTTAGTKQMQPSIVWCGYKYLVLYSSQLLQGTYNFDLKGSERDLDGTACGPSFTLLGVNSSITRSIEFQPAVASKRSGGSASDEALLTFTEADDAPPFASDVVASRYRALGPGGAITLHGVNCGNSGVIGANGPAAIGNTDFRITLAGAPPAALSFLLWSFPGGESVCGPCSLSNTLSAVFVMPSGGAASQAFPIPCSFAGYSGLMLQTQWAVLGSGSNPCPSFPGLGLSFTQRQRFTIAF